MEGLDPGTPHGERVLRRLREEVVVWYTSVAADGTPQPNPVWFVWEGATVLVYNRPTAARLLHLRLRPPVALHFDGNGRGGDIVVMTGPAELAPDVPPPHLNPDYLVKYESHMIRVSGTLERFSEAYPVAVRVRPDRVRGH